MAQTVFANSRGIAHKASGGASSVAFPDVCKVPAPPAPFAPIPYPSLQYQENLRKANKVDAQAASGNKKAIARQKEAISNLKMSVGDEAGTLKGVISQVNSASTAVMLGYTLHKGGVGKPIASKQTAVKMGMSNYPMRSRLR